MSRYDVGDRVAVILNFNPRRDATGVVARLPTGQSPWYEVDIDGQDEGQGMHFPVDEILGHMPPENPSPADMLAWLRS